MRQMILFLGFVLVAKALPAQKIDNIYFHLYTDSLKKGFYNYINVDGKTTDGNWLPLTTDEITLITVENDSALYFKRNDLFIDSAYKNETVTVRATLKSNPFITKMITIYIRKRGFDEPLKTNEEVWEELSRQPKKKTKNK